MIVEQRDDRLRPGLPLQVKRPGRSPGSFTTGIGELKHVIARRGHEGLNDRARCRAAMLTDPAWQEYLAMVADDLDVQARRIPVPSSVSPIP